jgi:hypothetical protein
MELCKDGDASSCLYRNSSGDMDECPQHLPKFACFSITRSRMVPFHVLNACLRGGLNATATKVLP